MSKKVCVIGAGAAGLVAARYCINEGYDVTVYEQMAQVGGTWVYSEETGCHSSMYKVLKTNLPKEAMAFEGFPFYDDLPSYMSHEHVLEYLEVYSKGIPIRFKTRVEKVQRENEKWQVTTDKDLELFDVVFVCNGHFFAPLNPFDSEQVTTFEGIFLHSHDYRIAEHYSDKTVAIIGAGPSGIDIALQVCQTAKSVSLISKKAQYPELPDNIKQFPTHARNIYKNGITIDEGEQIQADVIILCTGYQFEFPFFDKSLIKIKSNGLMVSPLYEHMCHVDYPDSLFFIGLPLATITFQLFEVQVKYALSLIARRAPLPSKDQLEMFETNRLNQISNPAQFHFLIQEQWEYLDNLSKIGRFQQWEYLETIRKLFTYVISERKNNVVKYKNVNFILSEDQKEFQVVHLED